MNEKLRASNEARKAADPEERKAKALEEIAVSMRETHHTLQDILSLMRSLSLNMHNKP